MTQPGLHRPASTPGLQSGIQCFATCDRRRRRQALLPTLPCDTSLTVISMSSSMVPATSRNSLRLASVPPDRAS